MPVKRVEIPDIPTYRGEDKDLQSVLSRVKTAINHLVKTDFVTDKDVHCRSLYVDSNSIYIGGVKLKKPIDSEDTYYLRFNKKKREFDYEIDSVPNTKNVQDIIGAMLTGNTETLITVTYQGADGTIDFVVNQAKPRQFAYFTAGF